MKCCFVLFAWLLKIDCYLPEFNDTSGQCSLFALFSPPTAVGVGTVSTSGKLSAITNNVRFEFSENLTGIDRREIGLLLSVQSTKTYWPLGNLRLRLIQHTHATSVFLGNNLLVD